jgi:putative transposase
MKYKIIAANREQYTVSQMCEVLGISRSAYYAWRHRQPSLRAEHRHDLLARIQEVHRATHQIYGSRRVYAQLNQQGVNCSQYLVARLMRENGLRACRQTRRRRTTTPLPAVLPWTLNVLARQFHATVPNTKWLADITYIDTEEGFLYLAAVQDMCSRRIVGWAMADYLRQELVEQALCMALHQRRPKPGLLHHSDRGSQYASHAYLSLLEQAQIQLSLSRVGNCLDNAPMESFFSSLKLEWVHRFRYRTRAEATTSVFYYIESFYNTRRLHSSLGYQSPSVFEGRA